MTIAKATIRTNTWDTIYSHLQTGNYALSTNNIFSAWNSTLAVDKGYPLVIIEPPQVSFNKVNVTGDLTDSTIIFNIEIYHNSSANVKALADEVTNSLESGRFVFAGVEMKNMTIEGGDYDTWAEGDKKIHKISFPVSFRYVKR